MRKRERAAELPREVISRTTYSQFGKFSADELGLVLLIDRHCPENRYTYSPNPPAVSETAGL